MTSHCFDCNKVFKMDDDPIQFGDSKVCITCCEEKAMKIFKDSVKSMLFAARKLAKVNRPKWSGVVQAIREIEREVS